MSKYDINHGGKDTMTSELCSDHMYKLPIKIIQLLKVVDIKLLKHHYITQSIKLITRNSKACWCFMFNFLKMKR
jgi:hypothetical protein